MLCQFTKSGGAAYTYQVMPMLTGSMTSAMSRLEQHATHLAVRNDSARVVCLDAGNNGFCHIIIVGRIKEVPTWGN